MDTLTTIHELKPWVFFAFKRLEWVEVYEIAKRVNIYTAKNKQYLICKY